MQSAPKFNCFSVALAPYLPETNLPTPSAVGCFHGMQTARLAVSCSLFHFWKGKGDRKGRLR